MTPDELRWSDVWIVAAIMGVFAALTFGALLLAAERDRGSARYCDGYCAAQGAVCHKPGDPPTCARVVGEEP